MSALAILSSIIYHAVLCDIVLATVWHIACWKLVLYLPFWPGRGAEGGGGGGVLWASSDRSPKSLASEASVAEIEHWL